MRGLDADRTEGTRGQAFTLEAVVASVVILGGLLFALQVSGVTSLAAGTSGGEVLAQQEALVAGALDAAAANGSLRPTILYWNDGTGRFHGSPADGEFYTTAPPTAFGSLLDETLGDQSLVYNVNLYYLEADGESVGRQALVRNGVPSDDASRATRTVTLYDDDRRLNADGTESGRTLADESFYAPDAFPDDPTYNVVRVEVVVWPV